MMQTYQMFFGRNIPNGGYVSDLNLRAFVEGVLDVAFDGYTIQHVQGVWKGEHENTLLVTVCTSQPDKIRDVALAYKNAFSQDSVGIQQLPAMSFV